jgi:hypothetical protein
MKSHFMAHDLKPILLIDDKIEGQDRGEMFVKDLTVELQKLVEFHLEISPLLSKTNGFEIEVLFDTNKYVNVFLHDSYQDPLLNTSQISDLKDKLRGIELITFSGGAALDTETKKIPREILYRYLNSALDAYLKMEIFPTSYLFGGTINRFYPIIDEMYQVLEEKGKDTFLKHKSFEIYTSICGWDLHSVQKNYTERFTEEQVADKINEWRLNFNQ